MERSTSHTVTFDANGGTGTMSQPDRTTSPTALTPNAFTRTGYTLQRLEHGCQRLGHGLRRRRELSLHGETPPSTPSGAINRYTVTFDANGGTGGPDEQLRRHRRQPDGQRLHPHRLHVQRLEHGRQRLGHGLRRRASYPFTANATLYAQWSDHRYRDLRRQRRTVTSHRRHADAGATVTGSLPAASPERLQLRRLEHRRQRLGHRLPPAATFSIPAATSPCTRSGAITYTVTYNGNGATVARRRQWLSGRRHGDRDGRRHMTRTGYNFAGWNTAADGSGTGYAAGSTFSMPATPVTLYAQWTPTPYSVTYNGNWQRRRHRAGDAKQNLRRR